MSRSASFYRSGFFAGVGIITCVLLAMDSCKPAWASEIEDAVTASMLEAKYGDMMLAGLGSMGPLGAYGPLGTLGPIGTNLWNPMTWMRMVGDWSSWATTLTEAGGPMSAAGPLGPSGPLGRSYRDFPTQFRAGEELGILGPGGVLGALGPLGPVGPMGGHDLRSDEDGRYVATDGAVTNAVIVKGRFTEGTRRTYPLFEVLTDRAAKRMVNDTSFMTVGKVADVGRTSSYRIRATRGEFVSIVVVPEKQLDQFVLTIRDESGKVLLHSNSRTLINWAHFRAAEDTTLIATVKLARTSQLLEHSFRLVVTGCAESVCRQ